MIDLKEKAKQINELLQKRREVLGLTFEEEGHRYTMKDLNGVLRDDYPSVSSVLKNFYTPFPKEKKALSMAGGDVMEKNRLLNEWKLAGDKSINLGSRTHFYLEKSLIEQYGNYKQLRQPEFECTDDQIVRSDKMVEAGNKFIDLMHERGCVLLDTEIVLGDPVLGYTGQPDKMWLSLNKEKTDYGIICTDWKGLPLDTPILTDKGWKTMGTLSKTDNVFDMDGNVVKIIHISNVNNKKCMKIKFDNNEEIISDFEHRWLVYSKNGGKTIEQVLTTQEIKDYYNNLTCKQSRRLLKIKNAKPLQTKDVDLTIDPYVFGVWLGDGHSACGMITQMNENVWNEIEKRGYILGKDVSGGGSGKAQSRTVFGLRTELRKLNLINNKHIPEIYLLSSYEQRLDILRGLMDSDGTFNKARNRYYISTTRKSQVSFSKTIISSLGLKPTVISYIKKNNNKKIDCYNIEFTTDIFNPFLCRNKNIKIKIKSNRSSFRRIIGVYETESVPTRCIEVNSPTNTFLVGETFIVTHNTNQEKNFIIQPYNKDHMLWPFNNYIDYTLTHYYVQIPLYARLVIEMLKNTDFENVKSYGGIIVLVKDDGTFNEYRVPADINKAVFSLDLSKYTKTNGYIK
jgi:hypothetical protein